MVIIASLGTVTISGMEDTYNAKNATDGVTMHALEFKTTITLIRSIIFVICVLVQNPALTQNMYRQVVRYHLSKEDRILRQLKILPRIKLELKTQLRIVLHFSVDENGLICAKLLWIRLSTHWYHAIIRIVLLKKRREMHCLPRRSYWHL